MGSSMPEKKDGVQIPFSSFIMPRGKKSNNHKLDNMDVINSMALLIEKERALSSIGAEKKEQRATFWRDQYMKLVPEVKNSSEVESTEHQWDNGIEHCPQLGAPMKTLQLCYCGITSAHLIKLVHKLHWLQNLTALNLSHNYLDDSAVEALGELLSPQIKRLNLSHNDLGPRTLELICNHMSQSMSLEVLEIEGNLPMAMDPDMADLTIQAVCKSGMSLNCLSLTINDFPENDLLATPPTTTKGKKKGCHKAPMGAFKVTQMFDSSAGQISRLSLCHARLHKLSINAIAQHALPKLLHLDLTGSFIGLSGAQMIAKRLHTAKNLSSLVMTRNLIGSTGICAITKALHDITPLRLLDVTSNDVDDDGGAALVLLMRNNANLAILGCGRNPLSPKGAIELAQVAREQGIKLLGDSTLPLPVSLRSSIHLDAKSSVTTDGFIGCIMYKEGNETASSRPLDDLTSEGYTALCTYKLDQCNDQDEELLLPSSSGSTAHRYETTLRLYWDIMSKTPIRWQVARIRNEALAVVLKEGLCTQQASGARSSFTSVSVTVGGWQIGADTVVLRAATCDQRGELRSSSQYSQAAGKWQITCKNFTIYEVSRIYPRNIVWEDSRFPTRSMSTFLPIRPPVHPSGIKLQPLRQILIGQRKKLSLKFQYHSIRKSEKILCILNDEHLNKIQPVAWAVTVGKRLVETGLLTEGLDAQHNYCSVNLGYCFEGRVVGLWIGSHGVLHNQYELKNTVHSVELQAIDDKQNEDGEDDSRSSLCSDSRSRRLHQIPCLNFSGPYAMCASAGGLSWAV